MSTCWRTEIHLVDVDFGGFDEHYLAQSWVQGLVFDTLEVVGAETCAVDETLCGGEFEEDFVEGGDNFATDFDACC